MKLLRTLSRVVVVPVKLVLATVGATFRTGLRLGRAPARLTGRGFRLVGPRGWFFFVVGVAVGLLVAPGPGRDLRRKVVALFAPPTAAGGDLRAKVAFELAHAPRTWHLPQPAVSVAGSTVTLTGTVGDEAARAELGRVAGAIPGVAGVVNQLSVPVAEPAADAPAAE